VFRHNAINHAFFQTHAMRVTTGGLKYEIYANTFNGSGFIWPALIRSGTGVIFDNQVSGYQNDSFVVDNQRTCIDYDGLFPRCNGDASVDGNVAGELGWPCLDQIGRAPGPMGAQPSAPLHAWNNGDSELAVNGDFDLCLAGHRHSRATSNRLRIRMARSTSSTARRLPDMSHSSTPTLCAAKTPSQERAAVRPAAPEVGRVARLVAAAPAATRALAREEMRRPLTVARASAAATALLAAACRSPVAAWVSSSLRSGSACAGDARKESAASAARTSRSARRLRCSHEEHRVAPIFFLYDACSSEVDVGESRIRQNSPEARAVEALMEDTLDLGRVKATVFGVEIGERDTTAGLEVIEQSGGERVGVFHVVHRHGARPGRRAAKRPLEDV
jgi:hypothetical protein